MGGDGAKKNHAKQGSKKFVFRRDELNTFVGHLVLSYFDLLLSKPYQNKHIFHHILLSC